MVRRLQGSHSARAQPGQVRVHLAQPGDRLRALQHRGAVPARRFQGAPSRDVRVLQKRPGVLQESRGHVRGRQGHRLKDRRGSEQGPERRLPDDARDPLARARPALLPRAGGGVEEIPRDSREASGRVRQPLCGGARAHRVGRRAGQAPQGDDARRGDGVGGSLFPRLFAHLRCTGCGSGAQGSQEGPRGGAHGGGGAEARRRAHPRQEGEARQEGRGGSVPRDGHQGPCPVAVGEQHGVPHARRSQHLGPRGESPGETGTRAVAARHSRLGPVRVARPRERAPLGRGLRVPAPGLREPDGDGHAAEHRGSARASSPDHPTARGVRHHGAGRARALEGEAPRHPKPGGGPGPGGEVQCLDWDA
mmetsp:Transcript_657/g.1571  ORF Transcript_657/g.1571 Transcript_657/m.1571 type:complete len:363 (+) Transcript_657:545-1633(+)